MRHRAAFVASASALALLAGSLAPGCAAEGGAKPAAKAGECSLYERLGGEPAISAVVDDFVARGAVNPKVNFVRKGTNREWPATPEAVAYLKKMLVEFIASATGGPQKYTGKTMKESHEGMRITNAEFDALAADLGASLTKFKVPPAEQRELLAIVETTRKDIVEAK